MNNESRTGYGLGEPIKVDRFKIRLPTAYISQISASEVPEFAMAWFETRSRMLINPSTYRPGNFERFFVIKHEEGDVTYAAQHTRKYGTNGDTENSIQLIDLDPQGNKEGHGEVRFNLSNPDSYFLNKPLVGYNQTEVDYRRRGLGFRRLLMMNAVSEAVYGFPLHSDTTITDEAARLWEKAVARGLALNYVEGNEYPKDRFAFKAV